MSCDPALTVFIALNGDTGDVYSAQCSCVAGLGEACNHVAALLSFFVEHAAKRKLDVLPEELSKTSVTMRWNQQPKKRVEPSALAYITFVKARHGKDQEASTSNEAAHQKRCDFDPRLSEDRHFSKA